MRRRHDTACAAGEEEEAEAAGKWRRALLTAALRDADADVVALQEVLEDTGKELPNQADTIARALGYRHVHFVAVEPENAMAMRSSPACQ